jgi:hypothetical protein
VNGGTDVNAKDNHGKTALKIAGIVGLEESAEDKTTREAIVRFLELRSEPSETS